MANIRRADYERITNETSVKVSLNLDGTGLHQISTGIGFLDHMLQALAVHGLLDLDVEAVGDLDVDAHHTIEDVAIVLGRAIDGALGVRQGIERIAHAYAPLDESLALVVVDCGGRPHASIDAQWHQPSIGAFPSDMVPHFIETLAVNSRCTIHCRLICGRNDHHQAEAIFKALARSLRAAIAIDDRRQGVASTKGVLD